MLAKMLFPDIKYVLLNLDSLIWMNIQPELTFSCKRSEHIVCIIIITGIPSS